MHETRSAIPPARHLRLKAVSVPLPVSRTDNRISNTLLASIHMFGPGSRASARGVAVEGAGAAGASPNRIHDPHVRLCTTWQEVAPNRCVGNRIFLDRPFEHTGFVKMGNKRPASWVIWGIRVQEKKQHGSPSRPPIEPSHGYRKKAARAERAPRPTCARLVGRQSAERENMRSGPFVAWHRSHLHMILFQI